MTKTDILNSTGLSESEFYKLYPTEESFKKKNPKMKLGGILKKAQLGYSFNDPDAPKVTTPNSNVLAIQAQQAQAAKRQKERALYARDQYQDLQTHPQLSGVPRTKEELMEEAQRRATNKFALQDKPWSEIVPDVAGDAALMMAPELLLGYGIPAMKNLWGAGLNSKAAKLLGKNPIGMTSVDPAIRGENAYKIWKDNKWIGDVDFENQGGRYAMFNIGIEDAYKGQGLGKSTYTRSNQILTEQGKGPLYSSGMFVGDDARNVWNSLTKEGLAKQLGEDSWRFKQSPLKEFFGKYGNRGRLDKAAREDVLLDNTSDLEFENLMQGLGKKEKPPYVQTQEDLDLIEAIRNSPQRTEEEMREMLRGVQRRYDEENMEIPDVVKEQLSRLQFGKRPLETNAKPESFIQKDLADWQRIALENDNFGVSKNNLNKNFPDPYTGRDAWREDMSPNKFGGQPCPECLQKAQDGWTNDQRYLTDTGYAQTMDSLFNSYINPAFENSRNDLRNEKNPIPSNWWLQDNNNMLDAWKKAERYPAPRMTYPEMQEQWNKAERNPKPAKIVPYKTGGSHMMPDGSIMADSEHGSLYKAQDGWTNPWQTPGASYPKDKYSQFNGMDESNFVHSTTPGSTRWVTKEGNRTPFQEMLLNYGNPIGPAFTGKDTLITRDPRRFDFKDGIADPDGWNTSESRDAGDQIRTKFYNMTYGSLGSLLTDKPDPLDQKYLDLSKQNQSVPQDIEKNLRLYSKAPSIKKTGGSVDQGIDSTSFLDDKMKKLIIHLKDTAQPAHDKTIQKEAYEEHQQQMQEMMQQMQGQQFGSHMMPNGSMMPDSEMPVQRFGGDLPKAQMWNSQIKPNAWVDNYILGDESATGAGVAQQNSTPCISGYYWNGQTCVPVGGDAQSWVNYGQPQTSNTQEVFQEPKPRPQTEFYPGTINPMAGGPPGSRGYNLFNGIDDASQHMNPPPNDNNSSAYKTQSDNQYNQQDKQKQQSQPQANGAAPINLNFDGPAAANNIIGVLNGISQLKETSDFNKWRSQNKWRFAADNTHAVTPGGNQGQYDQWGRLMPPSYTPGRYGKNGGQFGFNEGDEVDMTKEELEEFLKCGGQIEYL